MIELLIGAGIAGGASLWGYLKTRRFVRERLRFVDAVQRPTAPVVAGVVAGLAGGALGFLPFIGVGTAIAFGLSVGAGVSAGARDVHSLPPG